MLSYVFLVLIVNVLAIPEPRPEDIHIHIHGLEDKKPATNRMKQGHTGHEFEPMGRRRKETDGSCKTVPGGHNKDPQVGQDSPGYTCMFPFKSLLGEHNECIYDEYGKPWCFIDDFGEWGFCPEDGSCPIDKGTCKNLQIGNDGEGTYRNLQVGLDGKEKCIPCLTVSGELVNKPCKFPFHRNGTDYNECIYAGFEKPWCGAKSETGGGWEGWGNCPQDGSCPIQQECEWFPWINNDSPSKGGDYEWYRAYKSDREIYKHPKHRKVIQATCEVEKYEVMDAFGAVYTDVSSIHQNSLRFWQHGYKSRNNKPTLGCVNKHQKGCQVDKNGHRTGSSPPCCLDYKTRFCCKQTSSLPLRKECFSSGVLSYLAEQRLNDDANKLYKELEEDILPYVSAIIKHKLAIEITNEDIHKVKSLKKFHDNFDYDDDLASEYWWTIKEKFAEDLEEIQRILRSGYRMKICPPIIVTTTPYSPHHTTADIWDCPATWAQWGAWGPCEGKLRKKKRKCKSNCPPHNEAPPHKCTNLNNMVDPSTEWTSDPACAWHG